MRFIIFAIIGLILVGLSLVTKGGDLLNTTDMPHAAGVIDSIIYGETGNIMYYVTFEYNGTKQKGQTVYYLPNDKYHTGCNVDIFVHYTKAGKPLLLIDDNELTSCGQSAGKYSKPLLIIGTALIVAGVVLCIINH